MNISPEKLNELLVYCKEFAEIMLKDSGEFYPFGAVLNMHNEVGAVGAHNGSEHPNSVELYKLLIEAFSQQVAKSEILAAAIACNVNIPAKYEPAATDGVRVQLECNGFSRYIYFPFKLKKKGLFKRVYEVNFLEPIPVEINPEIF
ncbi:hypothetical protein D0C16_10510 [Cellvibrio sp. KY-GH-1]|uniref:hypothetical protein n=1 Tax=Cellvibrio sp. KY-GH-1 TaxID=2303332 RepID=UPI001248CB75|nr:hypothetical protein [Cellvibrio sp. KY-GH-1]QEY16374.1 hypothetical protein D0C16_10510 [Cellvibrio sp. KY-GH-1]